MAPLWWSARASFAINGSPASRFDVLQEMMRLTLAIVAKTLFSTNVDSEADDIGAALTQVFDLFEVILMPFSEILEKLPLPAVRRFKRARKRLDETIYRLIAERRAQGGSTRVTCYRCCCWRKTRKAPAA